MNCKLIVDQLQEAIIVYWQDGYRMKKKEKKELSSKKKELEKAKQNLTNPDYVEYIARGKYLVTKEGEQVFKFPSKDD